MSSSSSLSSLIPRRRRINNAVEGAGEGEGAGAGTGAVAGAAASAALAAVDEWKEKLGMNLKRALAKQVWESPLMSDYRDATLRHSEVLKSTLLTLARLSIVNCMLWTAFLRPGALQGVFSWTRLARAAFIAAMILFKFL